MIYAIHRFEQINVVINEEQTLKLFMHSSKCWKSLHFIQHQSKYKYKIKRKKNTPLPEQFKNSIENS
jgi:hypothetical protein